MSPGSQALRGFLAALALGAALALVFDLFRPLRRRLPRLGCLMDGLFSTAALCLFGALGLYVCGGELRLLHGAAACLGGGAYALTLSPLLSPLFRGLWRLLFRLLDLMAVPFRFLGKKSENF